jgi:hypothetical protein
MDDLVADIICKTFGDNPGKWQSRVPERQGTGEGNQAPEKALIIEFRSRVDYDKEEGYRYLDLVLYAPMNYVQVWVRSRWNVIAQDDLEYDEASGDTFVKKGADYDEGTSDWECIGNHDSCWRDSVRSFLRKNKNEIQGFSGVGNWYDVVPVKSLNLPETL